MSTTTALSTGVAAATTTMRAPRRFDTHTVEAFRDRLDEASARAAERVIDGRDVVFVDRDTVDALVAAGISDPDSGLRLDELSLAFRLTLELLGVATDVRVADGVVDRQAATVDSVLDVDAMERAA